MRIHINTVLNRILIRAYWFVSWRAYCRCWHQDFVADNIRDKGWETSEHSAVLWGSRSISHPISSRSSIDWESWGWIGTESGPDRKRAIRRKYIEGHLWGNMFPIQIRSGSDPVATLIPKRSSETPEPWFKAHIIKVIRSENVAKPTTNLACWQSPRNSNFRTLKWRDHIKPYFQGIAPYALHRPYMW